jgi:photosystem II stability/assembly factor-like uncharacterized protein
MKYTVIIFLLCFNLSYAQQGWFFLNPSPTGNSILDIKMLNEKTGICLGTNEILRTTNSGILWENIFVPKVYKFISLYMLDSLNGFVCADSNKILRTTNGGINWYYSSSIKGAQINKIYFTSERKGFALQSDYGYNFPVPGKIFRTTNGGVTWDSVSFNSNTFLQYRKIFFSSEKTGYITGTYNIGSSIFRYKIFKTTNGGLNWDSIPNPDNLAFGVMYFINDNTGYSGENYKIIKTTNGGLNWSYTNYSYSVPVFLKFNNDTGYCAGNNNFFKTTNGGINWSYLYTGISYINCFDFFKSTAVAGNSEGKIYFSTNSGSNWATNYKSIINTELWDIKFSDKNNGFAIGNYDELLKTTNGGTNWTISTLSNSGWVGLSAIANVNNNVCYISEWLGYVFKTTNAGLSWDTLYVNRYGIERIKFLNENTGFGVCKYGEFFKTTDGGKNWFHVDTLYNVESSALDFIDEKTGMIGGSNLYKTTDGGLNWRRFTSGTFGHIYDIKYINRDVIFMVGGYYSPSTNSYPYVYKTTNGGLNWTNTIINVNYIHLVQFPNEKTGYIQGYDAIYKTTDQGENWFRINSGLGYGLNSFHWTDSLTGYSVGINGTILKTTDGGGLPSDIPSFPELVPESFHLYQNYPNPFNPSTKIKFDLPKDGNVKIIIFDILGREIEKLTDEKFSAGTHEIQWDASRYSAGVYFYMLLTENIKETRKMILIK